MRWLVCSWNGNSALCIISFFFRFLCFRYVPIKPLLGPVNLWTNQWQFNVQKDRSWWICRGSVEYGFNNLVKYLFDDKEGKKYGRYLFHGGFRWEKFFVNFFCSAQYNCATHQNSLFPDPPPFFLQKKQAQKFNKMFQTKYSFYNLTILCNVEKKGMKRISTLINFLK